jgi:aspartate kinase
MKKPLLVFKFGGASVKDASAISNVVAILERYNTQNILLVVSAMGKTTNNLEHAFEAFIEKDAQAFKTRVETIKKYHIGIVDSLFEHNTPLREEIESIFNQVENYYNQDLSKPRAQLYDGFISFGELLSSKILQFKINADLKISKWLDARKHILTDSLYQKANVNWPATIASMRETCIPELEKYTILVTQGFIAANESGETTTLGREGSDYTAGIFAHALESDSVTIWKDVPGMLNADPKFFEDTIKLDRISFREAIELSYYGASVIHPKTLKPLQNKKIPLLVKSFTDPGAPGTIIDVDTSNDHMVPSFIFKKNQVLFSITPKDFSFLIEANLSDIFSKLSLAKVEINIMQNSALSFSFLIDHDTNKIESILNLLSSHYEVKYNTNLELVTVRHYDKKTNEFVCKDKKILLQQSTRKTARFVLSEA